MRVWGCPGGSEIDSAITFPPLRSSLPSGENHTTDPFRTSFSSNVQYMPSYFGPALMLPQFQQWQDRMRPVSSAHFARHADRHLREGSAPRTWRSAARIAPAAL